MSKNANNIDNFSSKSYYFGSFDSDEVFNKMGEELFKDITDADIRSYFTKKNVDGQQSFFGNASFEQLEGDIDTYIDMPLVNSTIDSFDGVLERIDMGGAFEKARLIATRNKQGIFDFGLASKGLIRPSEFYSDYMAKNYPSEFETYGEPSGIIPPDFVNNHKQSDGKVVFWYLRDGEKIQVQQRQYGVTKALIENPELSTKLFGNMLILSKPNKHLRFASTYDKCYLMHKKEGGKAKSVDLYVIQGGLGRISEKGMLLKTMPVLLAAKILEEAGIRTRIYAARGYYSGDKSFFFTYPIKNYGEDLDWNKVALNVGDPRIFRWKTWKTIAGILKRDYPSVDWNDDNGGGGHGRTLDSGDLLDETFERYKGYIGKRMLAGDSNKKAVDRSLMILGTVPNPAALEDADEPTAQRMILDEFYRIMDAVDFQFNKTDKVADRVFKRELESGKSKREIKRYLNNTLKRVYSVPRAGQFAAPQQEQDKIFSLLDSKLDKLYGYYEKNNY